MRTAPVVAAAAFAVLAALAACAGNPPAVPLEGPRPELDALAGDWYGEYTGGSSGSGSITLSITAGTDTAHGDVMMTPVATGRPLAPVEEPGVHLQHAPAAELLRIAFVRISGGEVQGSLEPFISPDCNCRVSAVFRGRVRGGGNRIEGTFRTTDPNGYVREGEWSVRKR